MDSASIAALQKAAQLFSAGKHQDAEAHCRKLLVKFPNSVDVTHLLALIRKQEGDLQQAELLFKRCISAQPLRGDIQANLGNLYKSQGRLEAAIGQYRQALTTDDSFRPARLGLARLLLETEAFELAQQQALELITHNQGDAHAWVVLAASQRGNRNYAEAEQAYLKALSLNPDYGAARQNLGALLVSLNRCEEAIEQLELAAACGVAGAEIHINRASALLGLGRFDEAVKVLRSLLMAQPDNADALEFLAKIRFIRGEDDFASDLARASVNQPANINLQILYARVLQGADLLPAAETVLYDALASNDKHPDLYCALAAVQQLGGKYEKALTSARQATVDRGFDTRSVELGIDALMALGRAEEALPLIRDGRQRFPLNQWYIAMEATVARLLGDSLYENLYDYEQFVQEYKLNPPDGWPTIEEFNADLITVLKQRHQFASHPLDQSLRHGTQTSTSLLREAEPIIKAFLGCLQQPVQSYRDRIGFDPAHPLKARNQGRSEFKACWSVRLRQGGFHVNHVHPEGWISSAYYVETPAEIDAAADQAGWIKFGEPRFAIPGASAEKFVKPKAGTLVLFPSYLWHGTLPIQGDEPRMTIAFDVITNSAPLPST